jgi:ParB family chromosome partitioning protein
MTVPEKHDDPGRDSGPGGDDGTGDETASLSDRLVASLTAHRTAAMRDCLAQSPDIAFLALTHTLAAQSFYNAACASCLTIELSSAALDCAPDIGDNPAIDAGADRTGAWARRLPRDVAELWEYLVGINRDELLSLLAVCIAPSVNALKQPWEQSGDRQKAADQLASALSLDMTRYWSPTVQSYFGSVTKAHILDAAREGASEEAAQRLAGMKKEPMAKAAEKLLKGSGWLPAILRTRQTAADTGGELYAVAAE